MMNRRIFHSKADEDLKANKNWIHPPDALQGGHIAYLVKYLGSTEVSESKGIDVVKEAIQKLRFSQQLKKSEGTKIPKVELTISVDGVAIQQPKSKKVLYQYPLHRISYCADDKAEKRFFSFIAKEGESEDHTCFVFVSDKLSEEITLTIGQAFDLAYRRFLETSTKEVDLRREITNLQKELTDARQDNSFLKEKAAKAVQLKDTTELGVYLRERQIEEQLALKEQGSDGKSEPIFVNTEITLETTTPTIHLPPVPPRITKADSPLIEDLFSAPNDDNEFNPRAQEDHSNIKFVSLENGISSDDDIDFDPRAEEKGIESFLSNASTLELTGRSPIAKLLPPPPTGKNQNLTRSPQTHFDSNNHQQIDLLTQFDEMQIGFSRGLSFGTADVDFNLDSLDPLKN